MPKITVDLSEDQHRLFVNAKLDRKEKSLQSLMIRATEAFLEKSIPNSGSLPPPKDNSAKVELTDDERDILAMLREKPERDFLFSSLQTTVQHALEQYRRKWKPPQEKATGQGSKPTHRRPA